jgi:hypothetical protein
MTSLQSSLKATFILHLAWPKMALEPGQDMPLAAATRARMQADFMLSATEEQKQQVVSDAVVGAGAQQAGLHGVVV